MERTNVYLEKGQLDVLRALGEQRGRPVAELIRTAVDEWLEREGIRPIPADAWEKRFERLLSRRERVARELGIDERALQRDVDATVRQVRKARAASRR